MKKKYFDRVSRKDVLATTAKDLNDAFDSIARDWHQHLADSGVKLPKDGTSKWYQLALLKHFQGRAVHKGDFPPLIAKQTQKPAADQQVRHLKTQSGWHVLNRGDSDTRDGETTYNPDGYHVLIATTRPHPNSTIGRRAAVAAGDWERILELYDRRCASCGTRIGEPHRFDFSFIVDVLERGHMDPNKPLAPGNIIPQCRWCNRTARGDFVFDAQGRPRAVANIRPVARADAQVISKIKKWIRDK